jgi:hypothetical protein
MSGTVTVILMYHRHNPIDRINLLGSYRRGNVLPVRYEHCPPCVLYKGQDGG